jgi:hypothetical protein
MSHHDDNLYTILGKLAALQPTEQQKHEAVVKQIYESVEAKGSVLAGVSAVEARLNEKYMGFKNTVSALKKQGGVDNPEALAASIGRKKYGKKKFQKAAATGKKLGEQGMAEGLTNFDSLSDAELIRLAHRGYISGNLEYNEDGALVNRDEIIRLLKTTDDAGEDYDDEQGMAEGEKPHPVELDMIGKTRELGVQNRTKSVMAKNAQQAAEPKTSFQHAKKVIGEPLGKLARGDIKGALSEQDLEEGPIADKVKKGVAAAAMVGLGATAMNPDNYNHRTPTANQAKAQQQAAEKAKTKQSDDMNESGLMASIGRKKHGEEYMRHAAELMRNGGTQQELGALRDRESLAYKNKKKVKEGDVVHTGRYGNDGKSYTGATGSLPKVQPDPTDTKFNTKGIAGMIGKKTGNKDIGRVTHRQKHEWDNSPEEVDEMFTFDTKGRNSGQPDELARRAKLGSAPLAGKYGKEYKEKDKFGDKYNVAGPKGKLPEGNDPFANVDPRVAKPTIPGTKNKAKSAYYPSNRPGQVKKLDKPTSKYDNIKNESRKLQIAEGINFAEMMKDTDSSVAEMLNELQKDINAFKQTGHCSDKLEAFLKVHNHGKKLMGEAVPKGPSFAPQHGMPEKNVSPFEPSRTQGTAPGAVSRAVDIAKKGIDALTGPDDAGHLQNLKDKMYKEDAALNELARLAGLKVDESEEVCMECGMYESKCSCEKCMECGMYEAKCSCNEGGNLFTGLLKDTPPGGEFEIDGKKYKDTSSLEENADYGTPVDQESNINISTNINTNGHKDVTINATGDQASELLQMLKIAGLGGSDKAQELQSLDLDGDGDELCEPGVELSIMEPEMEVDEALANNPVEDYYSMRASTMNPGEGDFGEKNMYGGRGDNRMTQRPDHPAQPVLDLAEELAAEYESIKKQL